MQETTMQTTGAARLLRAAVFMAVMYVAIQLAIAWGVDKKSWLEMSWEYLLGGSLGAMAGLAFFLLFGAIGWVCGALYGSLGLFWLMVGGAMGGLGLGALANIVRNPQQYVFHLHIILPVLLLGLLLAKTISSVIVRWAAARASPPSSASVNRLS
jgi:hypothetical protein